MVMNVEHLELSRTGRARCKLCREVIVKDALRMGVTLPGASFDGDMVIWHHAICAAHRRPTGLLRALEAFEATPEGCKTAKATRAVLKALATLTQERRVKAMVWRHPQRERCILEIGRGEYALFTEVGTKALQVEGDLETVLASVPDEDFEAAVLAANARPPETAKAPAEKPREKAATKRTRKPAAKASPEKTPSRKPPKKARKPTRKEPAR